MRILAKVIQLLPLNVASLTKASDPLSQNCSELDTRIKKGIDFLKVFANN